MREQRQIVTEGGETIVGIMDGDSCVAVKMLDRDGNPISWAMTDRQIGALRSNIEKAGRPV